MKIKFAYQRPVSEIVYIEPENTIMASSDQSTSIDDNAQDDIIFQSKRNFWNTEK